MSFRKIIGLNGLAGSGKDASAQWLIEKKNFEQYAFANALRFMAEQLDPMVELADGRTARLSALLSIVGWDRAKRDNPDVRRLLQRLGTEAAKPVFGDDCWTELMRATIKNTTASVVITDVRFPVEAEMIKSVGGVVWKIHRPGVEPVNTHVSERAMDGYPFNDHIVNDGTLEELHADVKEAYAGLERRTRYRG